MDVRDASARRLKQASEDRDSQALIASAAPSVIARLDTLIEQLDRPVTAEESPLRFYKLKNTAAADVLATIEGLTGDAGLEELRPDEQQDQFEGVAPVDAPPVRDVAPQAQDEPRPPIRPLPRDEGQSARDE